MKIRNDIKELLDEVRMNRRSLHRIPELGLDTYKTRSYLIEQLSTYGVDEIKCGYANQGIAAVIKGKDNQSMIAFRADMDALPIIEKTGVDFASEHEGVSHACGHDGHMANMLGLCHYLCLHKKQLKKGIVFIFQPGEEAPGGAERMIEDGLFQDYPISMVFGMHLMGDVEDGSIACKEGALMARNGEINVEIIGKSSHGAAPHHGVDSIVAASALVMQMQTIVSRSMDPIHNTVVTFGTINGGQVRNQIAERTLLTGTIRSFEDDMYELMCKRFYDICEGIEKSFGVEVKGEVIDNYYAVMNDTHLNDILKEVCGDDYKEIDPRMLSEDFSYYQRKVPGLFYFTGCGSDAYPHNVHDAAFNYDESSLLNSLEVNVRILEHLDIL